MIGMIEIQSRDLLGLAPSSKLMFTRVYSLRRLVAKEEEESRNFKNSKLQKKYIIHNLMSSSIAVGRRRRLHWKHWRQKIRRWNQLQNFKTSKLQIFKHNLTNFKTSNFKTFQVLGLAGKHQKNFFITLLHHSETAET